uniref:Uncharacterized protein n=1 Tax=Arundo donax TaxID=35708 RepID=A0A0A9A732_ARUDO
MWYMPHCHSISKQVTVKYAANVVMPLENICHNNNAYAVEANDLTTC